MKKKTIVSLVAVAACAVLSSCGGGYQYHNLLQPADSDHQEDRDYQKCDNGDAAACVDAGRRLCGEWKHDPHNVQEQYTGGRSIAAMRAHCATGVRAYDRACDLGEWQGCERLVNTILRSAVFGDDRDKRALAAFEKASSLCASHGSPRACRLEKKMAYQYPGEYEDPKKRDLRDKASIKIVNACEACKLGTKPESVCGTKEEVAAVCK